MKSICMIIIALLFFLSACSDTAHTDAPIETVDNMPSPSITTTAAPVLSPTPVSAAETPVQGLTHPVPYISEMRLYSDVDVFSQGDLAFGPITITSAQEDILREFGQPQDILNDSYHDLGTVQTYIYPDWEITFLLVDDTYVLQDFCLTGGDLKTPRDIGVGSAVRDTIYAYVDQIEAVMDNRAIFYRGNTGSESLEAVPPSGTMWRSGTSTEWILQFSIPIETNPYAGYTRQQIEDIYRTMWYYSLRFTTKYGKITQISMTMGHYEE